MIDMCLLQDVDIDFTKERIDHRGDPLKEKRKKRKSDTMQEQFMMHPTDKPRKKKIKIGKDGE